MIALSQIQIDGRQTRTRPEDLSGGIKMKQQWQKIETAPKSDLILVYRPSFVVTHDPSGEAYDTPERWSETYLVTYRWQRMKPLPTHWMPLPEPPNGA